MYRGSFLSNSPRATGSFLSPLRALLLVGVCAVAALFYISLSAAVTLSNLPFLPNRALKASLLKSTEPAKETRKGFPRDAACHPLTGQPHPTDGSPFLFECSALHPTGCVPRSQSNERYWRPYPLDSPGYRIHSLKDGYRLLASNNTDGPKPEAIAYHLKTANEPVCPADLMQELKKAAEEGRHEVFIDAGSNIGSCAVVALRLGHSVLAFEPGAENAALWRTNVALNRKLYPKTTKPGQPRQFALLLPFGLAEEVQQLTLLLDPSNSGNAMVLDTGSGGKPLEGYFPGLTMARAESNGLVERVCLVSIDWLHGAAMRVPRFLVGMDGAKMTEVEQEHWLGPVDPTFGTLPLSSIPRFLDAASLMKIDIQGHEFKLFKGAAQYLERQTQAYESIKKKQQLKAGEAVFSRFPMLALPAPPEQEQSTRQSPQLVAYGHFRHIFFELTMELVYRKGDDPYDLRAFLLERGFGISVVRNELVSDEQFKKHTDLGPSGHNHNHHAHIDLVARRLDLLSKFQ